MYVVRPGRNRDDDRVQCDSPKPRERIYKECWVLRRRRDPIWVHGGDEGELGLTTSALRRLVWVHARVAMALGMARSPTCGSGKGFLPLVDARDPETGAANRIRGRCWMIRRILSLRYFGGKYLRRAPRPRRVERQLIGRRG
mgnify:CR=1 FL=1